MNTTVKTRLVTALDCCSHDDDHGLLSSHGNGPLRIRSRPEKVHDPGRATGTIHGHCSYRDEYQTLAWWCPDYETQLDPGFRSSELSRTPRGRVCAGSRHETL
jgi:hypothetical protein